MGEKIYLAVVEHSVDKVERVYINLAVIVYVRIDKACGAVSNPVSYNQIVTFTKSIGFDKQSQHEEYHEWQNSDKLSKEACLGKALTAKDYRQCKAKRCKG